tara:strand:- start:11731 stop:11952 length:222 start_codon:yes stop_codon:yes gene_type:complete
MKITNSEYGYILLGLESLCKTKSWSMSTKKSIKTLSNKLKNEYNRLAKSNIEGGMTSAEEEIYPSRLNTDFGS